MKQTYSFRLALAEAAFVIIGILTFYPLYLTFVNGFKTYDEILLSTSALPKSLTFENFITVWHQIHFPYVFLNTLIITVCSILCILLISAAAAYQLVRVPGRISSIIFMMIISSLVIPFQTMMIPLVRVAKDFHLIDSKFGLIIMYLGFGIPLALFMYHGFIKALSKEIEEAAIIDGCSVTGVFFRVVIPLLTPISSTIAILHSLWIWNDFLLPYITLSSKNNKTISLASYIYFGDYTVQWHLSLAVLTLALIPIIVFYLFMQKYIFSGIMAGAIKS